MKLTKRAVLAIASFVLLLLQAFGLKIDVPVVNEVISAAAYSTRSLTAATRRLP